MQCDFCDCDRTAAWSYPAHDIEVIPGVTSQANWAACQECHDLIEAGDRAGLRKRCTNTLCIKHGAGHPVPAAFRQQLDRNVAAIHEKFYEARFGEAIRK